jgi:hypothetical protein
VAIVGNKFIFTNTQAIAKIYARDLYDLNSRSGCRIKRSLVFGGEVLTITPYGAPHARVVDQTLDYVSDIAGYGSPCAIRQRAGFSKFY